MNKLKNMDVTGLVSSVFAVIVGLLVGFIILLISNPSEAVPGFITILTGSFEYGAKGIGQIFYYATPLIFTGLSVGFAFKTGLFNIGAQGQFYFGALAAVFVGITMDKLGGVHWVVALLAAMAAGALWGMIPGVLNAYFNVNVVIACIMLNYVSLYMVNHIVYSSDTLFDNLRNQSKPIPSSAHIPKMGLDKIFEGSSVNGGFFIAILFVVIIYILLNKTTFGYELMAAGYNKDASKYAGMNEKRNIILSMVISGALAGLGGGLLYLAGSGKHIEIVDALGSEGYNGIPVALLGLANPVGILIAGIFIAYITAGGFYLQLFNFSTEIIDIIVAVIIYFSAFALIIKLAMAKIKARRGGK